MIDTIVLRIHDTEKYRSLCRSLDMLDIKGTTNELGMVKSSEIRKLRRQGHKGNTAVVNILKINRTGEYLMKSKMAKHMNASSHYAFGYHINYAADYVEFNFSIPKYLFGSNIMMFVDHIYDKDYTYHNGVHMQHNIERSYDLLHKFLDRFFTMEFINIKIDYLDVEVNRIDVCFNQIFRSEQDALKYLEYQRRQHKKHSRNEEGSVTEYATSIMYTTQRYSAKIYHKGTEFRKNDAKEQQKINKEKGRQYFKIKEYQALADRILRYELTIRHTMLNYLHKAFLFRTKCPIFQAHYKIYQQVDNSTQKNDRISKRIGKLPPAQQSEYAKLHPYERILPDARKIHKYVSKLITRRTLFTLNIDEIAKHYNSHSVDYYQDRAVFSKDLLMICLGKLMEFMREYHIKTLPPDGVIEKKIDEYNLRHRNKLPKTEMLGFYQDLCRLGNFRNVAKLKYYSRATIFRYKERFKRIGITESNLIPLTDDGIPGADLDLVTYHTEHTFNPHFLKKNNFLSLY